MTTAVTSRDTEQDVLAAFAKRLGTPKEFEAALRAKYGDDYVDSLSSKGLAKCQYSGNDYPAMLKKKMRDIASGLSAHECLKSKGYYQEMMGGLSAHERFGNIRQFATTGTTRVSDLAAAAEHLTLTGMRRESLANMTAKYSGILAECGTFSIREHLEKMQADAAKEWRESMDRAAAVARINVDEYLKTTERTFSPFEYMKEAGREARSLSEYMKGRAREVRSPFDEYVKEYEANLERLIRPNPAISALMRDNPPSEPQTPVSEPLRTPPQAQSPLPAPQPVPQPEKGISARHQPPAPAVSEPQSEPQFVIDGKAVSEAEYRDWAVSEHYRKIGQKGNYTRGAVKRQIIADFIRENRETGISKNQFAAKYHKRYNRSPATIRNILKKVTV